MTNTNPDYVEPGQEVSKRLGSSPKKATDTANDKSLETPPGDKKRLPALMEERFICSDVEKSWYEWWKKQGYFLANSTSTEPPLVLVLPPPNLTGQIGHALTIAVQDTLVRYRRMLGGNTIWLSAIGFAGCDTEHLAEKYLIRKRQMTPGDLGREEFVTEVLNWRDEYELKILNQLMRMGASLDWSHECYKMDEKRANTITEAFLRLHKEGLIRRDLRLVNWDSVVQRSVYDSDVEHSELTKRWSLFDDRWFHSADFGVLTFFAYLLEDDLGEIVVATTKVETMLGDTAIAVHPDDIRYKHIHGKFAIHPVDRRKLPIICDSECVGWNSRTGAAKICPSHDPKGFEVGKRHNLDFINIFTDDGKINNTGGSLFGGMNRYEARVALIELLKNMGLYRGKSIGKIRHDCHNDNVVEPMLKPQWYLDCRSMADEALEMAKEKIDILPRKYVAEYRSWQENTGDWCISRQSWWGVRVPAWYVTLEEDEVKELGAYSNHWVVARNEKEAEGEADRIFAGKKFQLAQDPDVLDPWFSSGLFLLSVLGWPNNTNLLRTFYPNFVIETGHENLFLWVARMVMLGIKFGDDVPFKKVYVHPSIIIKEKAEIRELIRNIIDPIEFSWDIKLEDCIKKIETAMSHDPELNETVADFNTEFPHGIRGYGADALRLTLILYTAQSKEINLNPRVYVKYGRSCEKLWKAVRFALSKLGDDYTPPTKIVPEKMPFICQWIFSVLNKAISRTKTSLDSYKFSDASGAVYIWWQHQLCDIFLEAIRPYFDEEDESAKGYAQDTLWVCLDNGLRLLHPFMPYITEELWQRLPSPKHYTRKESIMICEYPSVEESWTNEKVEHEMELVESAAKSLRSSRANIKGKGDKRLAGFVVSQSDQMADIFRRHKTVVSMLARLSSVEILSKDDDAPARCAVSFENEVLTYLKFEGVIDKYMDVHRVSKKAKQMCRKRQRLKDILESSRYFVTPTVPDHIKEESLKKLAKVEESLSRGMDALQYMLSQKRMINNGSA